MYGFTLVITLWESKIRGDDWKLSEAGKNWLENRFFDKSAITNVKGLFYNFMQFLLFPKLKAQNQFQLFTELKKQVTLYRGTKGNF